MSVTILIKIRSSVVTFRRPLQCRCYVNATSKLTPQELEKHYETLNLPMNAEQEAVRNSFLKLAKKYHPDSGSPEASIEKFVEIEKAFRTLSRHNTGTSNHSDVVDKVIFDIRHTAPQHRQYLSFEGVGIGTPYQRQKQWEQARAQRAAENVLEHRLNKAFAFDDTLMEKGSSYKKDHMIKTKYGFDRLVEDLIQESMSKGEFDNLSGKGKPLKNENTNPYVDFMTHKMNEVLINNGFTPEWITMNKEIEEEIHDLKEELKKERKNLGPCPLAPHEEEKWRKIVDSYKGIVTSINMKINKFNIIVPLMNKQKFHVQYDDICEEILRTGEYFDYFAEPVVKKTIPQRNVSSNNLDDFLGLIFKLIGELFTFTKNKN